MLRRIAPVALAVLLAIPMARAQDAPRRVKTEAGELRVETFATGITRPWGAAALPDGRLLVTEKTGNLRLVGTDGKVSGPLSGVPAVVDAGQGGLLDVALDPNFGTSRLVFMTFSEPGHGGAGTSVARGRLKDDDSGLENVTVIFRQTPKVDGGNHFGSRLAFTPDGRLFVGLGERFKFDPAQDLSTTLGKVVRINPDGSVPQDNPFVNREGTRPEIWSYGHRNIQGAAVNPATGELWTHEFGPRGGDEINVPEKGRNYGWPLVSWGRHYSGEDIPDPPTRPDLADAIHHWTPVISPSGMVFYTGDAIPAWRGNVLIGGLTTQGLVRLEVDGRKVIREERIPLGVRIRNVVQGRDGSVYLFTDERSGKILRLRPSERAG